MDILSASVDGIRLSDIEESLRLNGIGIRQVGGIGLVVSGPGSVRINGAVLEENAGAACRERAAISSCSEACSPTTDWTLKTVLLGRGVFGKVENNRLSGGVGLDCYQCKEVVISDNVFEDYSTGLRLVSSRPRIFSNRFTRGQLAMHISGSVVPMRLDLNIVQDSEELMVNEAGPEVVAINNWWGSDDEESIKRGMQGQILWKPFLNFDPRAPLDFALGQNYPNPFNASTVIEYQIGINDPIIGGYTRAVLEVRNMAGLLVRRLVDELASPGFYSVRWDGLNEAGQSVASGVLLHAGHRTDNAVS